MKFVVDMNISPLWVDHLNDSGYDAVHWSNIGPAYARDDQIVDWAREHERIILTGDLDFGTMLVASGASQPSVVQLRSALTLPSYIGRFVVEAIRRAKADLLSGALLTIKAGRTRIRVLPHEGEHQDI